MKKFVVVMLITILTTITLSGCSAFEEDYPYIRYQNDIWNDGTYDRHIKVPDGYIINDGHSYDVVETEDGFDIVFHFVTTDDNTTD